MKTECPKGTYGSKTGASLESECAKCPRGYYCEAATPGHPTASNKCPPGHFCLESTSSAFQNACPDKKYSTQLGLERADQCLPCRAGYHCTGGDPTGDTLCRPGYYCEASSNEVACVAGTYTELSGATRMYLLIYLLISCLIFDFKLLI